MPASAASHAWKLKPVEVIVKLPNPVLPDANWADAYEIETRREFNSMRSMAEQTIGSMPIWARRLLWVRNTILSPFGIKSDGIGAVGNKKDRVDIFQILEESQDQIVLGLDDWHLDFRIIVDRRKTPDAFRLRATTLVNRHNVAGQIYIAIIKPFHRLIVKSVLKNAI